MSKLINPYRLLFTPITAFVLVFLIAASQTAQADPTPTWRQYGHDAAYTHSNPSETILHRFNADKLKPIWKRQLGQFEVGPVTQANGVLYVCSNLFGLSALNPASGDTLWSKPGCASSPAIMGNLVYGSWGNGSSTLHINSFNKNKKGAQVWSQDISSIYLYANPTLNNGILYFSGQGTVDAVDAVTGTPLWQSQTIPSSDNGASIAYDKIYLTATYDTSKGRVTALDANSGAPIWTTNTNGYIWQRASVANGLVYFTAAGRLKALDAKTGTPVWTSNSGGFDWKGLAVTRYQIFAPFASGGVVALSAKTGKGLWQFHLSTASPASNIVTANGVVYFTLSGNSPYQFHTLYALDASSGQHLSVNNMVGGGDFDKLVVVDGRVYVSDNQGAVSAFGLPLP